MGLASTAEADWYATRRTGCVMAAVDVGVADHVQTGGVYGNIALPVDWTTVPAVWGVAVSCGAIDCGAIDCGAMSCAVVSCEMEMSP